MRKSWIVVAAILTVGIVCGQAQAARKFWTLDFKHTGLHYIVVKDALKGATAVPYTTYTVSNKTGQEVNFQPVFRVETETKQISYAADDPDVLALVQKKHGIKFLDLKQMTGPFKDGETKEGVAIFKDADPAADDLTLYVYGLTDAYQYQDEDARKGYQRKVYKVEWFRPGDVRNRAVSEVKTKFDDWIWRSVGAGETAPGGTSTEGATKPAPETKPAEGEKKEEKKEEKKAE
jgi:hypothetical protein